MISLPVAGYLFWFVLDVPLLYESRPLKILSMLSIGGYPLANSVMCVHLMRPYRMFFVNHYYRLLGRVRNGPTGTVVSVVSLSENTRSRL